MEICKRRYGTAVTIAAELFIQRAELLIPVWGADGGPVLADLGACHRPSLGQRVAGPRAKTCTSFVVGPAPTNFNEANEALNRDGRGTGKGFVVGQGLLLRGESGAKVEWARGTGAREKVGLESRVFIDLYDEGGGRWNDISPSLVGGGNVR